MLWGRFFYSLTMKTLSIPAGNFDAYIFDCDGTLADSMPLHYKAWFLAFKKHNAAFEFTWDLFYSLAGTGMHHSVMLLNERFKDTLDPKVVAQSQSSFLEKEMHTLNPIDDVAALAKHYAPTHPIAVASGGTRSHVHQTLAITQLAHLFPVVITMEDVENSKPAPDGFLLAAEKMGVAPEKCLVFEDSKLGLEAAERAGMQWVYVDPAVYSKRQ